ncbi:galactokinase [Basidiobolus meristosporus CBS 931.73]|uniref:Galactokinase n=1 Tax=Basidiobolus meristosporus CBS 931.73 TaxID=1314790 RepID=A0A1Y1YQA7_9FUNG|nr:galactokinase [Basidiobolus meristosporus CBS 931.73]|eukprot:ORY00221.1 galactokinase [Basidiobolus meristosporus CBS 931.73]
MPQDLVPVTQSLGDIYAEAQCDEQRKRYQHLIERFESIYGAKPDFIARSPGRVNIIGEHIDYAGFPVFPMAVDRDCLIAVSASTSDTKVRICNIDEEKYPAREFDYSKECIVEIDASIHEWTNYFKSGYKGMLERLELDKDPVGMNCLMDGSVPSGGGISSSAAFVCTAAMATMKANKKSLGKSDIVQIAIESERYVGVNSGGMDQTASVMSQAGSATFIEFEPEFRTIPVKFPSTQPAVSFVVANTMVTADKVVSAPYCYNLRVVETSVGAMLLAKELGLLDKRPQTFKQVMDIYFAGQDEPKFASETEQWIHRLNKMLCLVEKHIVKREGYTELEMSEAVGLPADEFASRFLSKFPVSAELFQLYTRAIHVFSESLRVVRFRDICESTRSTASNAEEIFTRLGDLMNQSQKSCRENFNCSCLELDELTEISRAAGAYGSRLTGAGWGGCTVSLVPEDKVESFISRVSEDYFRKKQPGITAEQLSNVIFASRPSSGAYFYTF